MAAILEPTHRHTGQYSQRHRSVLTDTHRSVLTDIQVSTHSHTGQYSRTHTQVSTHRHTSKYSQRHRSVLTKILVSTNRDTGQYSQTSIPPPPKKNKPTNKTTTHPVEISVGTGSCGQVQVSTHRLDVNFVFRIYHVIRRSCRACVDECLFGVAVRQDSESLDGGCGLGLIRRESRDTGLRAECGAARGWVNIGDASCAATLDQSIGAASLVKLCGETCLLA